MPEASWTTPVDVFLPRYRAVPIRRPGAVAGESDRSRPGSAAPAGVSEVTMVDVEADGYRLRLVDHPAAFDRDGFYGDAAGDYADNAWRFGLFCRAALEALRADGRPSTSSTSTTGTPVRRRSSATPATRTTRSSGARRS